MDNSIGTIATMVPQQHHVPTTFEEKMDDMISKVGFPLIRLFVALVVVWFCGIASLKQRLFSGFVTSGWACFLTYTFLEPLFVPIQSEMALVFLYILSIYGATVGLSLGVLLPYVFPGVCLGSVVTLLVGTFVVQVQQQDNDNTNHDTNDIPSSLYYIATPQYYFPIVGSVLAITGGYLSTRFKSVTYLTLSTSMIGGAFASCIVVKSMLPFLMDVARGGGGGGVGDYPSSSSTSTSTANTTTTTTTTSSNDDNESMLLPSFFSVQQYEHILLGCVWIASSILVAACIVFRTGSFGSTTNYCCNTGWWWNRNRTNDGYQTIPTNSNNKNSTDTKSKPFVPPTLLHPNLYNGLVPGRSTNNMNNDGYNMFDPADLPPRLAEYANMVYSACEDLGNFFGFQDSSVRNQAEHLLILLSNNRRYMSSHILPPSVQPPSPIHALHAKVFSNYVKWCRAMCSPPYFSKMNLSMNAPPAVASRVVDLVLFFCIWGESSNLRHMPECIWFLYHKMMEEYINSEGYNIQTRSLYAGHFLDTVVHPIYTVVAKNMASKADHEDKRNYDDFNEFFWSRNCLRYRYSAATPTEDEDDLEYPLTSSTYGSTGGGIAGPLPDEMKPMMMMESVADGLDRTPKTFLEKRSWLRGLLALNRIAEWHIVTFYILSVIAFARDLVWGWVYFIQVVSGVFWLWNGLHLLWALLEVWSNYPGIQLSGTDVCGSMFILLARFVTLVYQTLYLMWSFTPSTTTKPITMLYLGIEGDSIFWWWQYIWLSMLVMIPYSIEMILQLVPSLSTKLYMSQNDFVQSFLNILYPLSRLYVCKEVHESFRHTIVYILFWTTLLLWKLFFSYIFEVYSMVLPSLQLIDDYFNYPNQSFMKMMVVLLIRWLPQFIVYIIDMSIWYSVWQAFAGTSVGLSDQLGNIRTMEDIRQNFGRAPEHFCKKMLSPDAGSRRGSSASFLGSSSGTNLSERTSLLGSSTTNNSRGFNNMASTGPGGGATTATNPNANNTDNPRLLQTYVNRLLDVRIQKWVMFSAVWNEIIDHFRYEDIISNTESDNLKFSQFDGFSFSQAIYLPVFQTAGVIEDVLSEIERPVDDYIIDHRTGQYNDVSLFEPISNHITRQTAVAEVWELGTFVLVQLLGPIHTTDVNAIVYLINKWVDGGILTKHMNIVAIRTVMNHFVELISVLHKGIHKRKPRPKNTATTGSTGTAGSSSASKQSQAKQPISSSSGGMMRRVVSAGSLTMMMPPTRMEPITTSGTTSDSSSGRPPLDVNDNNNNRETTINMMYQQSSSPVIIDALRDQVRDKLRNLTHAIKNILVKDNTSKYYQQSKDVLDRLTFLGSMENGFFWDDSYAGTQLDELCKHQTYKDVLKKIYGLTCMHPDDAEPKSKEVRRRLTYFVNTLFMDMPDAPSIHDMFSWNVLTPYYNEDVTYSRSDLEKRTDALGVSTLLYLQTLYRSDWNNFLERMNITDEDKLFHKKYIHETRRWASIRAQTLTRTVHGMMYCEKALRLLANLERLDDDTTNDLIGEKFGYIVSCQVYGTMKRDQDPKADDIDELLHRFLYLRVAYIDVVRMNRSGTSVYYSCLIKSDGKGNIVEVYRIRLPDNPIIGEGKPENQNHASIFTRGEFVQTIDMNQEGYYEEALKMRNCLQEFAKRDGPLPITILGLREHIFTGSVSSLANYMALQEHSFVTLGQRVLTRPLHIRLHYGHPDVFDKLFFITRGGFSKASKGINLSEDIFAGYNNVVRGGAVSFKEYVQVGKGRDVGMSQIYKFEAKLSQGAAEQSLSRDVYRMCNRLDFCRLLSFYYGGIGHYFSNVLTIFTVYVVVYLMTILALFDLERIGDRLITPMGSIQMMLGGLGLLQTIPLFATLGVERGWFASLQEIFFVFATGGPLHFMFHIQTKAYYMSQTIFVGGAKYRPTGRGFVTQHTPFDEQYRFFASSHLYLGMELASGLILMGIYTDAGQYFGRTWSLWLASMSFLCSPFWFNPLTFDWNVVLSDYYIWFKWIRGTSGGASKSWSMWYNEENSFYKTLPYATKVLYLTKAAIYILIAQGIRNSTLFEADTDLNKPIVSVGTLIIIVLVLVVIGRLFSTRERNVPYPVRRTIGIILFVGIVTGVVLLFIEDTNYIRYGLASYYGLGALAQIGLLCGIKIVKHLYLVHDVVCGHIIFFPLFILAALQLPGLIQTWLLYHNALSTDVVVSDILRYARKSQESAGGGGEANEDMIEQITELRKIVQRQEQVLVNAGLLRSTGGGGVGTMTTIPSSASNNSVADLLIPSPHEIVQVQRTEPTSNVPTRAFSMSGLDVWGTMMLGDVKAEDLQTAGVTIVSSATTSSTAGGGSGGVIPMPAPPSSTVTTTSTSIRTPPTPAVMDGFSFSQPDVMPPR